MFLFGHLGFAAAPYAAALGHRLEVEESKTKARGLRWLLAGTILPDLVDKPIGQVLFKPYFENGRIYCHTILFASLVSIGGLRRLKHQEDERLLFLALGVASHLALDRIWIDPETALWPLLGPFKKDPSLRSMLEQIMLALKEPSFWLAEAGGATLLLLSLRSLGIENIRDLKHFLLSGAPSFPRVLGEGYRQMANQAKHGTAEAG